MRNRYYVVSLAFFCILILYKVNSSKDAKDTAKTPLQRNHPKPEEYDVKKFNGTVLVKLEGSKKVKKVEVGDKIKKVIFRIGKKRVHFNLVESTGKKTAVLTLKSYDGNVILKGGDRRVKVTNSHEGQPGRRHVGVTYI